ncbi:hypothetical protein NDU88_004796, partial [Pleurodeles waltl]
VSFPAVLELSSGGHVGNVCRPRGSGLPDNRSQQAGLLLSPQLISYEGPQASSHYLGHEISAREHHLSPEPIKG